MGCTYVCIGRGDGGGPSGVLVVGMVGLPYMNYENSEHLH